MEQRRGMARGRNFYIKGAANKQDISEETKDLLRNAKDRNDPSWQLGKGIEEPRMLDLGTKERTRATQYMNQHMDNRNRDGEETVRYYPHAGEEIPDTPPSPVLMVKRIKSLCGEPWFNKSYLNQIGLGEAEDLKKLSFLPNIPSVSLFLFKIKHLVEIKPVTFPNGMPDDFSPETHGYKLKSNGEFLVHPSLRVDPDALVEGAEYLKIERDHYQREAANNWTRPFNSPLGNSNYHADSRWRDNDKAASLYVKNKKKKWS